MIMSNFVFTVSFFLPTYGGAAVRVIAPNVVEAVRLAAGTEQGWMLSDPMVRLDGVERGFLASCKHESATMNASLAWECEYCPETWASTGDLDEHPAPTATRSGFEVYCQGLIDSGSAFR